MVRDDIKYDVTYAGKRAVCTRAGNFACSSIFDSGTDYACNVGTWAILTGFYYQADGSSYMYLQTIDGAYLIYGAHYPQWKFEASNYTVPSYSKSKSEDIIRIIGNNNLKILSNNLLCARFSDKLTAAEKKSLYDLQTRLEIRNKRLLDGEYLESVTVKTPEGYADLQKYLTEFMDDPQNGVGSLTVTIIVAAVVIASLSTAAYYAYRYYAKQSEDDVKFSKELTETLMAKLTPEEYEQLKKETAGIVTKSRIKQTLSTVGTEIKILGAAAAVLGGYILYKQWQSRRN